MSQIKKKCYSSFFVILYIIIMPPLFSSSKHKPSLSIHFSMFIWQVSWQLKKCEKENLCKMFPCYKTKVEILKNYIQIFDTYFHPKIKYQIKQINAFLILSHFKYVVARKLWTWKQFEFVEKLKLGFLHFYTKLKRWYPTAFHQEIRCIVAWIFFSEISFKILINIKCEIFHF